MERWGNSLVVNNTADMHQRLQEFFRRYRTMSKQQVLVEARFLQISDIAYQELGTRLGVLNFSRGDGGSKGNIDQNYGAGIGQGGPIGTGTTFNYAWTKSWGSGDSMRTVSLSALVNMLTKTNSGQVLHSPRLMTFNGNWAYTEVVTENDYIQSWQPADNANVPEPILGVMQQGVRWLVRPIISADRQYIIMEIRPTFARIESLEPYDVLVAMRDNADDGLGTLLILPAQRPTTETVVIETSVILPDNGVVLTGGLLEDRRVTRTSGVPVLSHIPYLGRVFQSKVYDYQKSNLVIAVHGKILELD